MTAQSALVGLSHAYYEMGRGEEAGRALQNVFRLPSNHPDPWFSYMVVSSWSQSVRLQEANHVPGHPRNGS